MAGSINNNKVRVSQNTIKFGPLEIVRVNELPDITDIRKGDLYIVDSSNENYTDIDTQEADPATVGLYQAGANEWITISDGTASSSSTGTTTTVIAGTASISSGTVSAFGRSGSSSTLSGVDGDLVSSMQVTEIGVPTTGLFYTGYVMGDDSIAIFANNATDTDIDATATSVAVVVTQWSES